MFKKLMGVAALTGGLTITSVAVAQSAHAAPTSPAQTQSQSRAVVYEDDLVQIRAPQLLAMHDDSGDGIYDGRFYVRARVLGDAQPTTVTFGYNTLDGVHRVRDLPRLPGEGDGVYGGWVSIRSIYTMPSDGWFRVSVPGTAESEPFSLRMFDAAARDVSTASALSSADISVTTDKVTDGWVLPLRKGSYGFNGSLGSYRGHTGADFSAPVGTAIYAVKDGVVTRSEAITDRGSYVSYGEYIRIQHADGWESRYAHQSKRVVRVGETVKAGQKIGEVGSTGRSTGPHLHFEIRHNGEVKDPVVMLTRNGFVSE